MPCYAQHLISLPFSNNLWLHSEYFVTPDSSRHWKLFLSDSLVCFSMSDACLMWLFGICNIVSNVKLRSSVRLVASVIFVLLCFLRFQNFYVFVPVLKPLLDYGKCIQCCHGLILFYICCCFWVPPPPQKTLFIQLCQLATMIQWFWLILFTLPSLHAVASHSITRFGLVMYVGVSE